MYFKYFKWETAIQLQPIPLLKRVCEMERVRWPTQQTAAPRQRVNQPPMFPLLYSLPCVFDPTWLHESVWSNRKYHLGKRPNIYMYCIDYSNVQQMQHFYLHCSLSRLYTASASLASPIVLLTVKRLPQGGCTRAEMHRDARLHVHRYTRTETHRDLHARRDALRLKEMQHLRSDDPPELSSAQSCLMLLAPMSFALSWKPMRCVFEEKKRHQRCM